VMQSARALARRVDPGLEHFEHEEIVPLRHFMFLCHFATAAMRGIRRAAAGNG
jgi:hypothetical protein